MVSAGSTTRLYKLLHVVVTSTSQLTAPKLCLPSILTYKIFVFQLRGCSVLRYFSLGVHLPPRYSLPSSPHAQKPLTRQVVLLWASRICHAAAMSRLEVSCTVDTQSFVLSSLSRQATRCGTYSELGTARGRQHHST